MEQNEKLVIHIIYDECIKIVNEQHKDNFYGIPEILISEFGEYNSEDDNYITKYILTLITKPGKNNKYHNVERQSAFIYLHTNLHKTLELLYNRTL